MAQTGDNESFPAIFSTKTQYIIPSQKFMVPSSWARFHLSELINKVLALPTPVPFDFIVGGDILKGTLAQWCSEKGVSAEENLRIEYVESMLPPQHVATTSSDDWLACVSCQAPGLYVAGSYNGSLQLHDASQKLVKQSVIHQGPLTSFCWVGDNVDPRHRILATASHDMTARLTKISNNDDGSMESTVLGSLQLHTAPISSIASDRSGSKLITASWDTFLGIWTTDIPDEDEVQINPQGQERERSKKRQKVSAGRTVRLKSPINVLKSHTRKVAAAAFFPSAQSGARAVSCSWDSTIRTWDVASGLCDRTLHASEKPFISMSTWFPKDDSSNSERVFVTSTDRTLSVYDVAASSSGTSAQLSFSHPALPSCIVTSPSDAHRVATGAYDGIVRIWDIRNNKIASSSFKAFTEKDKVGVKILAADWARDTIIVGGEQGIATWKIKNGVTNEDATPI